MRCTATNFSFFSISSHYDAALALFDSAISMALLKIVSVLSAWCSLSSGLSLLLFSIVSTDFWSFDEALFSQYSSNELTVILAIETSAELFFLRFSKLPSSYGVSTDSSAGPSVAEASKL